MARPLMIFYILVAYILLQFSWWAYLLIDLNQELVESKAGLSQLLSQNRSSSPSGIDYSSELKKRVWMVLGEGTVFLGLLVFGIYKLREAFKKEVALSRQQKNFLLSITHEFKSPLAAVKLNLQTLQRRELEKEQQNNLLKRSLIETERIHLLVENALFATRLESGNFQLYFESIDLSQLLEKLFREYVEKQDHQHSFVSEITPNIHIHGDQLALSSLVYNLLENAEKYSPENTGITLRLKRSGAEALIEVQDEGPGIPEKEKSKIFEKFYRLGNEDTRRTKGTGLGLFIVQQVVALHRGTVQVTENRPQGSIFEIRIKLEKPTTKLNK